MLYLQFDQRGSETGRWFSYVRYSTVEVQLDENLTEREVDALLEKLATRLSEILQVPRESIRTRSMGGIRIIDVISDGLSEDVILRETSGVLELDSKKIRIALLK